MTKKILREESDMEVYRVWQDIFSINIHISSQVSSAHVLELPRQHQQHFSQYWQSRMWDFPYTNSDFLHEHYIAEKRAEYCMWHNFLHVLQWQQTCMWEHGGVLCNCMLNSFFEVHFSLIFFLHFILYYTPLFFFPLPPWQRRCSFITESCTLQMNSSLLSFATLLLKGFSPHRRFTLTSNTLGSMWIICALEFAELLLIYRLNVVVVSFVVLLKVFRFACECCVFARHSERSEVELKRKSRCLKRESIKCIAIVVVKLLLLDCRSESVQYARLEGATAVELCSLFFLQTLSHSQLVIDTIFISRNLESARGHGSYWHYINLSRGKSARGDNENISATKNQSI